MGATGEQGDEGDKGAVGDHLKVGRLPAEDHLFLKNYKCFKILNYFFVI